MAVAAHPRCRGPRGVRPKKEETGLPAVCRKRDPFHRAPLLVGSSSADPWRWDTLKWNTLKKRFMRQGKTQQVVETSNGWEPSVAKPHPLHHTARTPHHHTRTPPRDNGAREEEKVRDGSQGRNGEHGENWDVKGANKTFGTRKEAATGSHRLGRRQ